MMTEKNALGRVLLAAKEIYSEISRGELAMNVCAALDALSAAYSHVGDEKEPLAGIMKKLKRELKTGNKHIYPRLEIYFRRFYAAPSDFDFDKAKKHVPAMIFGNDRICEKFIHGEYEKVKSMSEAMKSYPGFLLGEFASLTDEQFFDLVFGYYPKFYDEEFMEPVKELFVDSGSR